MSPAISAQSDVRPTTIGASPPPGYTVRRGDTLSAIAERHGTSWQALARLNGLANPDLIRPGQQLRLPDGERGGGGASAHTVVRGDTLAAIAARAGTSVGALARANRISDPDLIFPGQVLRLPARAVGEGDAARPAVPPAARAPQPATGGIPQPGAASVAAADYARDHVLARSAGYCYRYVKQALQATGAVPDYLPGAAAKDAGPHLERRGFVNLLDRAGNGIASPYDAPPGAVIVYGAAPGATDRNARYGHIEIRTRDGFASDYFSANARTGPAANGLEGRGRVVTGIYVRPDANAAAPTAPASQPGAGAAAGAAAGGGGLSLGVNARYAPAITEAAQRTGIAPAALAAIVNAEAAKDANGLWRADSRSGSSSATGLTQFLSGTWLGEARRAGGVLNAELRAQGLVDARGRIADEGAVLARRTDPRLSILAAADYARGNLEALRRAGVMPQGAVPGAVAKYAYLAHHEGSGGAIRFLRGEMDYVSRGTFNANVPASQRAAYLAAAGGDMGGAYRAWLGDYMDRNIDVRRFMADPAGTAVPDTRTLGR